MKKICICGKIKETRNIFEKIEKNFYEKILLQPLKHSGHHYALAIFNKTNKSKNKFNCPFIIVNTDTVSIVCRRKNTSVITVGLNSRAAITLSSITDNRFMFCIRKTICTISGKSLCQQEFPVNTNINDTDVLLTTITAALLCDAEISDFSNLYIP